MTRVRTVHRIGAGCITHDGMTTCGIIASKTLGGGEYAVSSNSGNVGPIRAVCGTWDGVTCKSCLRNPHAPGGRYHAVTSQKRASP